MSTNIFPEYISDDFDVSESREGVYLQSAVGEYLDAHSRVLGVNRKLDESDEHFRNRLIYETLAYLTVEYLVNVFDLVLYYYIEDFDASDNTLTSDNPFIDENGFMAFVDEDIKKILESKFVLGSDIKWLTQ